jgi:hypothetical protein
MLLINEAWRRRTTMKAKPVATTKAIDQQILERENIYCDRLRDTDFLNTSHVRSIGFGR